MTSSWFVPDLAFATAAEATPFIQAGTASIRAERAYRDEMPTVNQEVRVALAKRETALMYQRWANEAQRQGKLDVAAKYRDKAHSARTVARSHMVAARIRKEADE